MLREENLFEVLHRYKPSQMNVLFVVELRRWAMKLVNVRLKPVLVI